jgi:hypothetical protein
MLICSSKKRVRLRMAHGGHVSHVTPGAHVLHSVLDRAGSFLCALVRALVRVLALSAAVHPPGEARHATMARRGSLDLSRSAGALKVL